MDLHVYVKARVEVQAGQRVHVHCDVNALALFCLCLTIKRQSLPSGKENKACGKNEAAVLETHAPVCSR